MIRRAEAADSGCSAPPLLPRGVRMARGVDLSLGVPPTDLRGKSSHLSTMHENPRLVSCNRMACSRRQMRRHECVPAAAQVAARRQR